MATSSSWYKSQNWTLSDEKGTQSAGGTPNYGINPNSDKVKKAFAYAVRAYATAREGSEKGVKYLNNNSWSQDEINTATKLKKPTLKYNVIVPIISTLQGNEQLNKKVAKFKPTTVESVGVCDIIQQRWNALIDEQDIEDKLQIAFVDSLATRVGGWIERSYRMTDDGYLDFYYEVVNNMRVFCDPETKASDYMLKNCRWIIKEGWERLDVLKDKYDIPTVDTRLDKSIKWYDQLSTVYQRFTNKNYTSGEESYDKENDRYQVLEMQERVTRKTVKIFDGNEYFDIDSRDYKTLKLENPNLQKIMEYQKDGIHITTIIPYFSDIVVLNEDLKHPTANFDLFPVFSYNYNVQITEQTSLVDLLIDVQDDINKGKSQVRDYVTQILSGGIFIDKREKATIKRLKSHGNQPNQVYELNNPAIQPQKMAPQTIPPDIMLNTENSFNYAQRVSLISEAMKGETARSGESGVLFEAKVERAAAAINPYFKNLSRLRKALAQDFVDNFAFIYSEMSRVIQVKEDNVFKQAIINLQMGSEILMNVNNPSIYVELDEGTENITTKEDNFNKMMALVNVISQINPAMVDIQTLIANAPIVGSDKMLEYITNMLQSQAESAEQDAGINQQQIELDNTKKILENMKIERGMVTDEEKLRLEAEKIRKGGNKNA